MPPAKEGGGAFRLCKTGMQLETGLEFTMDKGYLLFDGAFGTYYAAKNPGGRACELANVEAPETVLAIHREYIEAGAQAVKTNTFAANGAYIPDRGLLERVLCAGYALASQAAGGAAQVYADIGPAAGMDETEQVEEYLFCCDVFLKCGATHFLFETLSDDGPARTAAAHIKRVSPQSRVLISFAVDPDGYTGQGRYYRELIKAAWEDDAIDAAGLNCLCGPFHLKRLVETLGKPAKPLTAMPNAGYPANVSGRTVYLDNTGYFAEKIHELYAAGATILGGCCGTTPAHIRAARTALSGSEPLSAETPRDKRPRPIPTAPKERRSAIAHKLETGKLILAAELDPPSDTDPSFLLESAARYGAAGADIITVTDSPLARPRADSVMTAARIKRETGMEVMPHLACRDKNEIGIRASLLAGYMEGVSHVLAVTGDPVPQTDRADIKGVYSFASTDLLRYIGALNEQLFSSRPFFLAAAINVNAANFDAELLRARKKLDAGASLFLTQPVCDETAAERAVRAGQVLGAPVLAGLMPLAGYKNAVFMNNEVQGVRIPAELIARYRNADRQESEDISVEHSLAMASLMAGGCRGFYLITPLRRSGMICRLLSELRRVYG